MPAEYRRRAAMRTPALRQFARLFLAWARPKQQDAADGFLHRQIARGPDIGATLGKEKRCV